MVGTDNTITLDTGILRRSQPFENPEVICFSFSSGTVTVKNPAGRTIFMHSLMDGLIVRKLGSVEITTGLVPNTMVESGSTGFNFFNPFGENSNIEVGSALVRIIPTAEPRYARAAWNWPGQSRWFGTFRTQRRLAKVRVSCDRP